MTERVQVIVEAKDSASGVLRAIAGEFGKIGALIEDITTSGLDWGKITQFATVIVIDAFKQAYNAAQEYAGQVRDLSLASGATAEQASRLLQVLDDFEIGADDVTAATRRLTQNGLTPTIETIAQLSDEYLKLNAGQQRNQFIQDNLGRAGAKWNFLLSQGSEKILAMNEAVSLNLILNEENLSDLDKLRLAQDAYNDSILGYQVAIVTQAAPALVNYLDYNTQLLALKEENIGFFKEQGEGFKLTGTLLKDLVMGTTTFTDALQSERTALQEQAEAAGASSESLTGLLSLTQKLNDATREQIKMAGYQQLKEQLTESGGILTPEEADLLNQAGVALGIFDQHAVNSAASVTEFTDALAAGNIKLSQYVQLLNSIPTSIDVQINQTTVSSTQGSILAGNSASLNAGSPQEVGQSSSGPKTLGGTTQNFWGNNTLVIDQGASFMGDR